MRLLLLLFLMLALGACGITDHTYHSQQVVKPRYHHTWYKDSRWHKKIQVGRVRVRLFEKQGVKTVRMRG